ncbi:MAG TPA: MFS transporter [Acidimicrobiales bacterium]|nr:MFS transporter [Acidimicrobiales bacterium]
MATREMALSKGQENKWQKGDREQLAVVAFSHAIQHSYIGVLGIVYPFALVSFHSSYAVLGGILGVAGVLGGLLQGTAVLVKRISSRVLLGGQNLGMALVSVLGAISPGIAVFGAVRVLGNLVSWPQHPVGAAHLVERMPNRRGFALAVHTTGGNIGTLLAPLAAAAVITAFSWRWALAGAGIVMALCSVVTWTRVKAPPVVPATPDTERTLPDSLPDSANARAGMHSEEPVPVAAPVSLRQALRRRKAIAVLIAGAVSGAGRGVGVLTTFIPAYLRIGLHQPALTVGAITAVVATGAVFGPVLGGHISDRLGRSFVLYILYGLGACALVGFVLVGNDLLALGFIGLAVGVFSYSEQPLRQALFSDSMQGVSPRQAFGAYFAISQSIGAVWITILGVLVTTSGFRATFLTMAGSFIVAGSIIFFGCHRETAPPVAVGS